MSAAADRTGESTVTTTWNTNVTLEVDDIQAPLLHPRPTRYAGAAILVRIDDRRGGRELLRRLIPYVPSAAGPTVPDLEAWAAVALSFQGLKALGVPEDTLARFPPEFRQGMAARAAELGDTGASAPEHWEAPLGGPDVHVAIYALAPDDARLEATLAGALDAVREVPGVEPIWRQDTYMLETERTSFGFKDGISNPAIEGSGIPGTNPHEAPSKPGEFVLGYPNEVGNLPPMPEPEVLGRNGSYVVFRKLQTRVAEYRQYLRARAKSREEEELLAAKFVGRWPSGAPLVLAPARDDPELGADPERNNGFCTPRTTLAASIARSAPTPAGATRATLRSPACLATTGSSGAAPATARCCPRASSRTTGPIAASCSSASRRSSPGSSSSSRRSGSTTAISTAHPAKSTRSSARTTGLARSPSPSSRSAGA